MDASLHICQEYAKNDSRIICIHNEKNYGVGYTRNRGIDLATGKYIVFLDADDWLDSDFLYNGIQACLKNSLDMYLSGKRRITSENIIQFTSSILKVINIENRLPLEEEMKLLIEYNYICSSCGNILSRSLIENNNSRFEHSMTWGEDLCFIMSLLKKPMSVMAVPEVYYNYRVVQGSLVSKVDEKKCVSFIKTYDTLYEYGNEHGFEKSGMYQCWIDKRMINDYVSIQRMILKSHNSINRKIELMSKLNSSGFLKSILLRSDDKYVRLISVRPVAAYIYYLYSSLKTRINERK